MPAAAGLVRSGAAVTWVVDPKWAPLLTDMPGVSVWGMNRRSLASLRDTYEHLRSQSFTAAYDFQGLIKSGLVVRASRARRRVGFAAAYLRERPAAWFYTEHVNPAGVHVVEHNMSLAAVEGPAEFPLPEGAAVVPGLPERPYILASARAGWAAKEWPQENYPALAEKLRERGLELVMNRPEWSLLQLVTATRRAAAVVGLDSGPMHLAAALRKPGVALFGPTSPERNGPYGGSMIVLRDAAARTTYKRVQEISPSMRALTVERVWQALARCLDISFPNLTPTQ